MVSIVQPDSNEDSQGRQLCVNKRLSKVVSSAPRARFQKARPKVPSLKRELASAPVQTKSQPITLTDRSRGNKEIVIVNGNGNSNSVSPDVKEFLPSSELSVSQSSLSEEWSFKCDLSETKATENESHVGDSADVVLIEDNCVLSKSKEAISSEEKHIVENSTASPVDQNGQLISDSEKYSESCSSSSTNCEDEVSISSLPLSESGTVSKIYENEKYNSAVGKSLPNTDECTSDSVSVINDAIKSPSSSKEGTEIEIPASTQNASSVSSSKVQSTADTNSKDRSHTETCETLQRSVPNTPTEERHDISPSTTEKSSKYPHLTSILSKKRVEPKRDVPHKKRKRYKKGDTAPERSKMTMADLIYWNPTSEDAGLKKATTVDDAPAISNNVEPEECPDDDVQNEEENPPGPVPRLIISEDGEINIDQVSLVIQRKTLPVQNVIERNDDTTYSSFRKRPLSKHWTTKETTIFYKALSLVGTDFGLMEKLLPDRTRRELKLKFKREEKYNIDLVNKAMYDSQLTFDENTLEEHIQMLNSIPEVLEETQESDQSSFKENKRSKASGKYRRKKSECADIEVLDSPAKTLTNANGREMNDKEVKNKNDQSSRKEASYHNDKNGASHENVVCNKKKRKKKQLSSDFITIDESTIDLEADMRCLTGANGEKVNDDNDVSGRKEMSDKNGSDTNSRRRKKKKLPDDFISIDDIEDITDLATGVDLMNGDDSFLYSPKRNHKGGTNQHKSFQKLSASKAKVLSDKTCNENPDGVEILYLEELTNVDPDFNQDTSKAVVIAEGSALTVSQIINDSVLDSESSAQTIPYSSDNQETECVTVNIIQNYDSMHEINPLNVVANEIVTSQTIKTKRRRNAGNPLKKPKKVNSVNEFKQPSFTNYTPAEESLLPHEKNLNFHPEPNLKTYSKTHSTPESSNGLVSSLQTPVTPLQSSSLLTSLNVCNHQPKPISLTPQANASSNPVMLLAKSPNTDNVIHLFMYKSPSS